MTSTYPNKHERRHRHVVPLFQLGTITANAITPLHFLLRARSLFCFLVFMYFERQPPT
jgi:hypothetical protein